MFRESINHQTSKQDIANQRQVHHRQTDSTPSYMHEHGCGRGEHNKYLYYEAPSVVPEQSYEQQQEHEERLEQQKLQSRRRQSTRN